MGCRQTLTLQRLEQFIYGGQQAKLLSVDVYRSPLSSSLMQRVVHGNCQAIGNLAHD